MEIYFCYVLELEDSYEVYRRPEGQRRTQHGQQYAWQETQAEEPAEVRYASVKEVDDMTVTPHSTIELPLPTATPSMSFWDALRLFENQSLWKYFWCNGNGK